MTTLASPDPKTFLLEDVSWDYYTRTLQELDRQKRHVRVTFDQGRMEFMTFTVLHEFLRRTLGRLVETYSIERGVRATSLGSLTYRRQDLQRGLEPDECYYVTTEPPPAEPTEIDLTLYGVPDLAIEVDITHSSIPRQSIYAALGVPEIWRHTGHALALLRRQPSGTYAGIDRSDAFPELTAERLAHYVQLAMPNRQYDAVVAFRDWLRANPPR
jgi:Uma2 family endonuclease